ncbi:extracellular solute-binding protein [Candidatus Uhrbacteria bacterium]|nr:extracellular solute-binding protein [Candidatus Uhrbacteria bacterium]
MVRANDILATLMMQNGTVMEDDNGRASFHEMPFGLKRTTLPGVEALRFYTDFANPSKDVYAWNSQMPNSLDAFISGQTAMFFGYSFHVPVIKARAPKLNLGLAKLPQIEGNPEVNFANYWVEVVSKKSKNPDFAWNLVQFLTRQENVKKHLDLAKKPTALRALINDQSEDLSVGVFASQLLTAKSWYQGKDPGAAEKIFGQMIDQSLAGAGELPDILNLAANRINQTTR